MDHSAKLTGAVWMLGTLLLGLLAGMSFLIWKDQKGTPIASSIESIDSIRLVRAGFSDIVMSNRQGQWLLTSPCSLPVNTQRLEPLLGALQPAGHSYKASEVDLDAAGLTPPQATVYLNEKRIELGHTDLQGNRRYAMNNDSVEFVPEWVLSLINGGITAFARLEPFGTGLSRLTIDHTSYNDPEQLDAWKNISAQQIIQWSTLDLSTQGDNARIQATVNAQPLIYEIHRQSEFIALRVENADCAYILPPDALPSS